jgi:hypothetical protein
LAPILLLFTPLAQTSEPAPPMPQGWSPGQPASAQAARPHIPSGDAFCRPGPAKSRPETRSDPDKPERHERKKPIAGRNAPFPLRFRSATAGQAVRLARRPPAPGNFAQYFTKTLPKLYRQAQYTALLITHLRKNFTVSLPFLTFSPPRAVVRVNRRLFQSLTLNSLLAVASAKAGQLSTPSTPSTAPTSGST